MNNHKKKELISTINKLEPSVHEHVLEIILRHNPNVKLTCANGLVLISGRNITNDMLSEIDNIINNYLNHVKNKKTMDILRNKAESGNVISNAGDYTLSKIKKML